MQPCYDVVIIGAGVLGCFTARALTRYNLRVAVLEAREDVCTGISKANTAIVYDGHDTRPGTLKTQLCVKANEGFDLLCQELGVRFHRCGGLMVCSGPRGEQVLRKKYEQGLLNGVKGLRLLGTEQVHELEPALSSPITAGLYSPATGTVDPWELCFAAFENAKTNGAEFYFNRPVTAISAAEDQYLIRAGNDLVRSRSVINCAGLYADQIRELLFPPYIRIIPSGADYMVTDTPSLLPLRHILFQEPEEKGKGLTLVPTVDGNLLIGPSEQDAESKEDHRSTAEGQHFLQEQWNKLMPPLPPDHIIRRFSALRPNPYYVFSQNGRYLPADRSIHSFTVLAEEDHPRFISLIGIKTPGLTCAWELGKYVCDRLVDALENVSVNPHFDPVRPEPIRLSALSDKARSALIAAAPSYGHILCRCRSISRGEILDAIHRGAVTLDGVKRRIGSGMGRCQGSWCTAQILQLLAHELEQTPEQLCKDAHAPVLGGE